MHELVPCLVLFLESHRCDCLLLKDSLLDFVLLLLLLPVEALLDWPEELRDELLGRLVAKHELVRVL